MEWDLIPKHIVAMDAYRDFSAGNFYIISDKDGSLVRIDGEEWSVEVLLSVRPSAALDVVNGLLRKIKCLEGEICVRGGNE